MDSLSQLKVIYDLILSFFLGAIVGIERTYLGKVAGIRTYSLVCVGATIFTIISRLGFESDRIAAGVVTGIGFIGAGLIIHHGYKVEGVTTAAGLWAVAAIGMAVGSKLYIIAILGSILIVGILAFLRFLNLEQKLDEFFGKNKT